MLPADLADILDGDEKFKINYFQPIEVLKGQCYADFMMNSP